MFKMFVAIFLDLKSICYEFSRYIFVVSRYIFVVSRYIFVVSRYIFVVSRYIFVVICATFYEMPRNQRGSDSDAQVVQQICSPSIMF
jgi:hypothetical protein